MPTITESSITLNLPDHNFFRLGDCQGYKSINEHFKEMDVCWYDSDNDTLYLIELKDWMASQLLEREDTEDRINNLVKKSIDCVCIFMAILLEKPQAISIQKCSPFLITNHTKIKLLSIINCDNAHRSYFSAVHHAYKTKFSSYAKLFNIQSATVLTKDIAIQKFSWVS